MGDTRSGVEFSFFLLSAWRCQCTWLISCHIYWLWRDKRDGDTPTIRLQFHTHTWGNFKLFWASSDGTLRVISAWPRKYATIFVSASNKRAQTFGFLIHLRIGEQWAQIKRIWRSWKRAKSCSRKDPNWMPHTHTHPLTDTHNRVLCRPLSYQSSSSAVASAWKLVATYMLHLVFLK